jgi:hypothetical protein
MFCIWYDTVIGNWSTRLYIRHFLASSSDSPIRITRYELDEVPCPTVLTIQRQPAPNSMHGPRPSRWQVPRPEWLTSTHDNPTFWQRHRFTRSITVRRRIGDASYFSLDNLAGTAGAISPTYGYLFVSPLRPVPAVVCELSEPRICPTKANRPTSSLWSLRLAPLRSHSHQHRPILTHPKPAVGAQLPLLFTAIHSRVRSSQAKPSLGKPALRAFGRWGRARHRFSCFDHRLFRCC